MKDFNALYRDSEKLAEQYGMKIDEVALFSDKTIRIVMAEKRDEQPIGFQEQPKQ